MARRCAGDQRCAGDPRHPGDPRETLETRAWTLSPPILLHMARALAKFRALHRRLSCQGPPAGQCSVQAGIASTSFCVGRGESHALKQTVLFPDKQTIEATALTRAWSSGITGRPPSQAWQRRSERCGASEPIAAVDTRTGRLASAKGFRARRSGAREAKTPARNAMRRRRARRALQEGTEVLINTFD